MELRKATKEDFEFFYKIKSEPENMYWTGHETKPNIDNLRAWFYRELENDNRYIFIAFCNNIPVGYAYIYFIEENKGLETAVAVSSEFSGLGFGTQIVKRTIEFCFKNFPDKYIQAWILTENTASVKIHQRVGYKKVGISKEHNNNTMHLYKIFT